MVGFKRKILAALTLTAIFCFSFFAFAFSVKKVSADEITGAKTDIYLPSSYLQYRSLSSPTDVYHDEEVTAFLQQDNLLTVYYGGKFTDYSKDDYGFTDLSQIIRLGDYLLMQDDLKLKAFSFKGEPSYETVKNTDDEEITCKRFSLNGEYLVTLSTSNIYFYKITLVGGEFTLEKQAFSVTQITTGSTNRVAINNNNDFFYFNESGEFCKNNVSTLTEPPKTFNVSGAPNGMIADGKYVYFSFSNKIERLDFYTGETVTIKNTSFIENKIDDLVSPMELCFASFDDEVTKNKGTTILVCDKDSDKIVCFTAEDEAKYTGFAITTTSKNASNRLSDFATGISVKKGLTAIVNNERLTVNKNGEYLSYALSEGAKRSPIISLGDNYAALINLDRKLYFLDLRSGNITAISSEVIDSPVSISYSGGLFYVYALSRVYTVSDEDLSVSLAITLSDFSVYDKITTDIDGNLYRYRNVDKKVYVYEKKKDIEGNIMYVLSDTSFPLYYDSIKIATDLNGNIYSLTNDNIIESYYFGNYGVYRLTLSENLPDTATATDFALSYDEGKIYFLFSEGFVLTSEDITFDSIDKIAVPFGFILTSEVAAIPDNVSEITVETGANIYLCSETVDGEFIYQSGGKFLYQQRLLAGETEKYLLLGNTELFYILASGQNIYLVKKANAITSSIEITEKSYTAYLCTSGNIYSLPIITQSSVYVLTGSERIAAETEIEVLAEVLISDKSFVYATANGKTGYIPFDFITETLAKDFISENYQLKTLSGDTVIYKDKDLTEEIKTLKTNDEIFIKDEGEVYKVRFLSGDNYEEGYVSKSSYTEKKDNTMRNSLIIIIVALSVSATSLFFVLRKKD